MVEEEEVVVVVVVAVMNRLNHHPVRRADLVYHPATLAETVAAAVDRYPSAEPI